MSVEDDIMNLLRKAGSVRTISEITDGRAETKGDALLIGFDRLREGFRTKDQQATNDGWNVLEGILSDDVFDAEFMVSTISFLAEYVETGDVAESRGES